MKKSAYLALFLIALAAITFMLGPKAAAPILNPTPIAWPISISELDAHLKSSESRFKTLKSGNEASITWVNDSISKTPYAIVFLHGFSASKMEGRPVTTEFAKEFGMNLFEPRLYGHGLDTSDSFIDLTPENYIESAKEAIALAKVIGEKVIIMGSSTGATLGLYLAANDPSIAAVFCYSPNIDIFDPNSKMLTGPWGLQLARLFTGSEFREYDAPADFKRYWQTRYRLEGLVAVRQIIEATMVPSTFEKIHQPVFVGCYFKNEAAQDSVVSVSAMRNMMGILGTTDSQKRMNEFPNAGAHVITNPLRSKDVASVQLETRKFAIEVLGLKAQEPVIMSNQLTE